MSIKQDIFYNKTINKKELKSIVHSTFQSYGIIKATNLAEKLKKTGFAFATQAGISISIEDLKVPPTKDTLFAKNNTQINLAYFYEKRGNINEIERFQKVIDTWHTTSEILKNQLVDFFKTSDPLNPVYMMAFSGARGNLSQVRQLVGMRGLMSDPNGQIIDLPIKTNFREGLSITDYVISSYGARKGIVDTALRTADSGYLTRRLVDVAQHVIIRELDCQTKNGVRLAYNPDQNLETRYLGRVLAQPVIDPISKQIILERNTTLTVAQLTKINFSTNFVLRSPLICESSRSICQKCYGWNLSQGQLVELADAVGVIAAQSIGEPGTQLTMRTFHTGGVFTGESSNQIRSTVSGQILFSANLKTVTSRTIYGEVLLKAQNSSEFFIFDADRKTLKRYPVKPEMLIFVNNKSFVTAGDVIAELPLANKRTTTQLKDVFTTVSGEVQFQNIQVAKNNNLIDNGLIWIAEGEIYDLFPSMLLKMRGSKIVKNNAIAQTKIISPIGGMVKFSQKNSSAGRFVITPPSIFISECVYKTSEDNLFLLNADNKLFTLHTENDKSFGRKVTNKFTLVTPYIAYYSRVSIGHGGNVQKLSTLVLCPEKIDASSSKRPQTDIESFLIETSEDNCNWDKKIVYPGEVICDSISISKLSYCYLTSVDDKKSRLFIVPLKQGIIPKSPTFTEKFTHSLAEKVEYLVPSLKVEHEAVVLASEAFAEVLLEFSTPDVTQLKMGKSRLQFISLTKTARKRLALFDLYKLPSNFSGSNNLQTSVSNFISENQFIDPYSVIATLNIIAADTLAIENVKNVNNQPNRFLISLSKSYKECAPISSDLSKFLVIGDKMSDGNVSDYSGYVIREQKSSHVKIRLSTPFFVSQGTRILINHGSLIRQGESLCQLVYTRVISDDIVTGLPRIEQLLESRLEKNPCDLIERPGIVKSKNNDQVTVIEKRETRIYNLSQTVPSFLKKGELVRVAQPVDTRLIHPHNVLNVYFQYYRSFYELEKATKRSVTSIQILLLNLVQDVYRSQGIYISDKHVEIIVRQITSKVKILKYTSETTFPVGEFIEFEQVLYVNRAFHLTKKPMIEYEPVLLGITKVSLLTESFISAASFQETTRILTQAAVEGKVEWLRGLKENVILGRLIPAGTGFKAFNSTSMLNVRLD